MNATLLTNTDTRADAADAIAVTPELTEQDWARLEIEYRAKCKKEIADYRERFGEEPDLCTLIAAEWRAECNNMTDGERARARAYGMAIYNAASAAPHAKHTIRS